MQGSTEGSWKYRTEISSSDAIKLHIRITPHLRTWLYCFFITSHWGGDADIPKVTCPKFRALNVSVNRSKRNRTRLIENIVERDFNYKRELLRTCSYITSSPTTASDHQGSLEDAWQHRNSNEVGTTRPQPNQKKNLQAYTSSMYKETSKVRKSPSSYIKALNIAGPIKHWYLVMRNKIKINVSIRKEKKNQPTQTRKKTPAGS